ncbi:MAG: hypothetical protein R6U84_04820 [Candidatus Cloacimonadales bacterium]
MKKILIVMMLLIASLVWAYEQNMLVEAPTAGILQRGEAELSTLLYKDNGMIIGTKVGLFPRFMFGVSYGAEKVVGNEDPIWHDRVEFSAKFRLMDENANIPAVAIGYDSKGYGKFYKEIDAETGEVYKRFDTKSKGFYLVASSNRNFMGNLGVHAGINYSLERDDNDDDPTIFVGLDKSLGDIVVFCAEYDLALNDNENFIEQHIGELSGSNKGYLNASFDVHFTENLVLKIAFKDLLKNKDNTQVADRTITLNYYMTF